MRLALAQINPKTGDSAANAQKILSFARRAHEKRAHLVIFPELSLFGYPAYDLLEREEIVSIQEKELLKLSSRLPEGLPIIIGAVIKNPNAFRKGGKPYWNAGVLLTKGRPPFLFQKVLLPSYDIFDDTRFFEPGKEIKKIKIPGIGQAAVSVCEDMWAGLQDGKRKYYSFDPMKEIKGVDLVVNISASPFSPRHQEARIAMARKHAQHCRAPFVYVNQVGGQDENIFDGGSFVLDKKGKLLVQAASCVEDLVIADLAHGKSEYRPHAEAPPERLRQALVLGLRDFVSKTNQKNVHLGLSGGIDSAVVAALAVDALGPGSVTGLLLPGPFSSEGSLTDSLKLAKNLHIKTHEVSISEIYDLTQKLSKALSQGSSPENLETTSQNIQARLRCLILMAYSNLHQSMLLCTTNKSELATGFGTIYGDLTGGLAPLADLVKRDVYLLAQLYNSEREVIPNTILEKAPSAELAPNQKDQDSLPPYESLDQAVINIVEKQKRPRDTIEKWLVEQLSKTEWKRWQTPPILRVSERSFGRGRRFPIAR